MEWHHASLRTARCALFAAAAWLGPLGCADEGPVETPLAPPFAAGSADEVLSALQRAYAGRDFGLFAELLATEEGAVYEFHFPDSLPGGATSWDATEELRMHRRLWRSEGTVPGEPPGSPCPWRVTPAIVRQPAGWTERPEFYRSASNPQGLDPGRWRATGAGARSDCLIETWTETGYRILNDSQFIVIEDRAKRLGAERKFLLYRWFDLDGNWKSLKVICS